MIKWIKLLASSRSFDLFCCQNCVLIHLSEDRADSFKSESACNHLYFVIRWIVHLNEAINLADLRWIINGLDIDTNTMRIIRILWEVAIQMCRSLLHARATSPMIDKLLQLLKVHERNIIYMTIFLSIQDDRARYASMATAPRIRWMILAIIVHSVAHVTRECTVRTLLIAWVRPSTFF